MYRFAGDLRAATVLQHHRCTVGSFKGEGMGCGGGKILEPDIVVAATFAERQGEFFILIQHRAKGFPIVLLIDCQQSSSTLFTVKKAELSSSQLFSYPFARYRKDTKRDSVAVRVKEVVP